MSSAEPFEPVLALHRETTGEAVEVFEGLWILATRHRGGGFSRFPEANNRAFILRLVSAQTGRPGLVVFNATEPGQSLPEIERLRRHTGLPVTHVVSSGGGHHSFMSAWHDALPQAQLRVGAERVPRTTHGAQLLRRPRVAAMDPDEPLPEFGDQLDALSFRGLLGPAEFESPTEAGRDSLWATVKAVGRLARATDRYDELWIRHRASATVIGGENLAPRFSAQAHAQLPWLVRKTIAPQTVSVRGRKVGDRPVVARCWTRITAWSARHLLGYHDSVGAGFVGDVPEQLWRAASSAGQLMR